MVGYTRGNIAVARGGTTYKTNPNNNTNYNVYCDILLVMGIRKYLYKTTISPEFRNLPAKLLAPLIKGDDMSLYFYKIGSIIKSNKKIIPAILSSIANNKAFGGDD